MIKIKRCGRGVFFNRIFREKKGQSIVEITLIAPLLLLALYVPADFGISLFTAHLAENAVREGTRIGTGLLACGSSPCLAEVTNVNCPSTNDVAKEVCDRLPDKLTSPKVTVNLLNAGAANCAQSVQVTVSGTYNFFLYQLAHLLGITGNLNTMTITRSTQMRYVYQLPANETPCT
jgi:Flp pilus assembly protein TadG